MSGHTPGPWDAMFIASPTGVSARIYGVGDKDVAHIPMQWNAKGDAALIAAAPDMLAALRLALPHHQGGHSEVGRAIRAAIARAEGKP